MKKSHENAHRIGLSNARIQLEEFIQNPGWDELVNLGSQKVELPDGVDERIAALRGISGTAWDFRNGAERQSVAWGKQQIDDPHSSAWGIIFSGANKLGMIKSSKPDSHRVEHAGALAILGGANRAPLDRLRYGISTMGTGFADLVLMGADRAVSEAERDKTRDYALGALTEFDLCVGAAKSFLDAKITDASVDEKTGLRISEFKYKLSGDNHPRTGHVINSPKKPGSDRASTGDNYRALINWYGLNGSNSLRGGAVGVTTAHYVPAQLMSGIENVLLPTGTVTEVIGHNAAFSGVTRFPSQLLEETRKAILNAASLSEAIKRAENS